MPTSKWPGTRQANLRSFTTVNMRPVSVQEKNDVAVDRVNLRILRMVDAETHHAHLQHLVRVRVVHGASTLLHNELVNKILVRRG